ncbi:MAG: LptE family protein [Candidatus Aminicenantes bacterium]|nr:LptE family protein [Candidatus Aminicenantes bacterium]
MKRGPWLLLLVSLLNLHCGYHLAGRGRNLPAAARTVAIPAFVNETSNFGAERFISVALREEFLRRSRLRLCAAPEKADLLLEGRISAFETVPVAARRWEVRVSVHVRLIDLKKNELVYDGSGLSFREAYTDDEAPVGDKAALGNEVAKGDFFSLAAAARDKIAAKLAAGIVSSILDNF